MKYLTKEWYILYRLSGVYGYVRVTKYAEKFDEDTFQRYYKAKWQKKYKKLLSEGYNGEYDLKELVQEDLEMELSQTLDLFGHLPQEILDKVADLRMLALGYAGKEAKKALKSFCLRARGKCGDARAYAHVEKLRSTKNLSVKSKLFFLDKDYLLAVKQKQEGIYIRFEKRKKIFIQDGRITEPASGIKINGMTEVVDCELHNENDEYELCFLLREFCKPDIASQLKYFTIVGSKITSAR